MAKFKILALDGGGVRGVYAAAYLEFLERQIGSPIHKYFDLVVGTSTGGLIALGLSLEISAERIKRLYLEDGPSIFPKYSVRKIAGGALGILRPKYSRSRLETITRTLYAEANSGVDPLLGAGRCRLCIPAVDLTNGKAIVFKTRHRAEYVNDYTIPMWEVAMATSAAPAFFPSYAGPNGADLADGGLWANNPSMVGVVEALKLGVPLEDICVLSVASGSPTMHKGAFTSKSLGLIGWGPGLIEWIFQTQSYGTCSMSSYALDDRFVRIDTTLPPAKRFCVAKYGLDKLGGMKDLTAFAERKAKETFIEVQRKFLISQVTPFNPIPATYET